MLGKVVFEKRQPNGQRIVVYLKEEDTPPIPPDQLKADREIGREVHYATRVCHYDFVLFNPISIGNKTRQLWATSNLARQRYVESTLDVCSLRLL